MEYSLVLWVNHVMHAHALLARVVVEFSTWGVPAFGVLAVGLWLLSPPGDTTWKRACTAGLAAAAAGLAVNQALAHVWDRARPYEVHPNVLPLLTPSHDPSFPSDHATAALSIAFGVFFVSRRAGWLFLGFGVLVAASRVLAGMHYPTDVLGSLVVSAAAGYLAARVAMRPVLVPLILLASRITDPILARVAYFGPVRRTVLEPRVRAVAVVLVFAAVLVRIGIGEGPHLLDEMDIGVLAAWVGVGALAVRLSLERFWPAATRTAPVSR